MLITIREKVVIPLKSCGLVALKYKFIKSKNLKVCQYEKKKNEGARSIERLCVFKF